MTKKTKELNEYSLNVPVKGYKNFYVLAKTRKEAIKKIKEMHDDVEVEFDDLDWDIGFHEKSEKYIEENVHPEK